MTGERWRRASPHLDHLLELRPAERSLYLQQVLADDAALAADLGELLAEDQRLRQEGFLEHDAQELLAEPTLAGQTFGAYVLERPLGAGGMGSVWLARRSDGNFEGLAAVKLLSAALLGAAGASRFRREATILARLQHPHIAQLLDAGVSPAGQPFLVLEYVDGESIDRWCDDRSLDLTARLRLFLDVLAAVAHAHSNLVVHADLKPSNVLVSRQGQVKLLDFGIAKLLEGEARDGNPSALTLVAGRAFTPACAAPEQVSGENITTATDVYGLGALLYLLLVGRYPTESAGATPAELLRAVLETVPALPSDAVDTQPGPAGAGPVLAARRATSPERLRRALRGDLDTIVAKTLKKRPGERYGSVAALGEDLRRYLAREPILARPDSWAYKAGKFARRHARSLAAAAALAVALAAVVAFYTARLARERDRATRVSGFLTDLLTHADPFVAGQGEPTVKSLLAAGAARARQDLVAEPELERDMLTLLGRIHERRGDYAAAVPLLEEAVALARKTVGPSPQLAQGLNDLGVAYGQRAELAAARTALEEALALRRRLLGAEHPLVAVSESELGRTFFDEGRFAEAEAHFRTALAIRRQALGSADHETATSMSDLGLLLRQRGDRAGAEALLREALEVTRAVSGPQHPDTGTALGNLALTVSERGDLAAAEAMFREAVEIGTASLGAEHPDNAGRLANLAFVLRQRGKLSEAAATYDEALRLSRQALGPEHPAVARQEVGLARVELDAARPAVAEALLRHALAVQQAAYVADDWRLGSTESLLGEALVRLSRPAEAEPHLLRALAVLQVRPDAQALETREALANRSRLVALYRAWGRPEQAAAYLPPP